MSKIQRRNKMEKKKIAETVNVRINVGNFQHIEISKYAEREITYENKEEMITKEDNLTEELVDNILRNMNLIVGKMGKDTNNVSKLEERITKTIPEFMKGSEEPNLAKKNSIKAEAEQKDKADNEKSSQSESKKLEEDLFGDDGDSLFGDE